MSDKPARDHKEWLRKKVWPFSKRAPEREGADSIMPHLQEFLDQAKLLGKSDDEAAKERKSERDSPRH